MNALSEMEIEKNVHLYLIINELNKINEIRQRIVAESKKSYISKQKEYALKSATKVLRESKVISKEAERLKELPATDSIIDLLCGVSASLREVRKELEEAFQEFEF